MMKVQTQDWAKYKDEMNNPDDTAELPKELIKILGNSYLMTKGKDLQT